MCQVIYFEQNDEVKIKDVKLIMNRWTHTMWMRFLCFQCVSCLMNFLIIPSFYCFNIQWVNCSVVLLTNLYTDCLHIQRFSFVGWPIACTSSRSAVLFCCYFCYCYHIQWISHIIHSLIVLLLPQPTSQLSLSFAACPVSHMQSVIFNRTSTASTIF